MKKFNIILAGILFFLFGISTAVHAFPIVIDTSGMLLGTAGSVAGKLLLAGSTSGTVTVQTQAAAGTWNFTLPDSDGTSGQFLKTDGSGITSWDTVSGSTTATTVMSVNPAGNMGTSAGAINTNTTMKLAQVYIPYKITANKITTNVQTVNTSGTVDLTLYAEDGQSQIFSVTSGSISAGGNVTTSLSSVVIEPGVYYFGVNPNSTTDVSMYMWTSNVAPFSSSSDLNGGVSSEPVMTGTLTITAGTPPATFDPTALTAGNPNSVIFRLDN